MATILLMGVTGTVSIMGNAEYSALYIMTGRNEVMKASGAA